MMLQPEQARDLLAFLDECGTHWPQGPDQEAARDALRWHADGPGGVFLDVSDCTNALHGRIGSAHPHSLQALLKEKLERGAAMAYHGNP